MAVVATTTVADDLTNKFFQKHDQGRSLREYRNFIPKFVLEKFCSVNEQSTFLFVDQYQVPQVYSHSEKILTLYLIKNNEFVRNHLEQCFGKDDIYSSYFDNFTTDSFYKDGFKKLVTLKKVDSNIYNNVSNALWGIVASHEQNARSISITRPEYGDLRKALYLMTSLGNRDKTMHVFAHEELMEGARVLRREFKERRNLDHIRDIWLLNAEQILETPHSKVAENKDIFDFDRMDYHCNARNRFLVFWEAPPGDEFLLTDTAFGGFEGGQIGDRENSTVDVDLNDLQKHIYTKDFMWHQIYVLSPTLCVALCHPTLMHPEVTKMQRKNWGLRRSLLEGLPHGRPRHYYKDVTVDDGVFPSHIKTENLPSDVKKEFGKKSLSDRHKDDEMVFPIQQLQSEQVALVNSVLLQNQTHGVAVNNVCIRPSAVENTYRSLINSLKLCRRTNWTRYTEETQNNYIPLLQALEAQLNTPQEYMETVQSSTSVYSPMQQQYAEMSYALTSGDVPVGFDHLDPGRNLQLRAHSASTQSSLTSSFAPSSQSSYYSSTSSQSSASTKTTSIDTPRFEPKEFRASSPPRKEQRPKKIQAAGQSQRGSDSSGKTARSKKSEPTEWEQPLNQHNLNIVVDQPMEGPGSHSSASGGVPIFRGRNPDPVHYNPPSNHSSKKGSPNPTRAELDSNRQRYQEPAIQQMAPPTRAGGDRSNYSENSNARPRMQDRARTEPQVVHSHSNSHVRGPTPYGVGLDQYMVEEQQQQQSRRVNRSPESQQFFQEPLPQPPRRRSPERPQVHRNVATAPVLDHRYEQTQPEWSKHSDSRSRPVRVESQTHSHPQRLAPEMERVESQRSDRSQRRNHAAPQVRNSQAVESVEERMHKVFSEKPDLPAPQLQPRAINRSPDRKQEPPRHVAPTIEKAYHSDSNGRVYNVAHTQGNRSHRHAEKVYHSDTQSNPYRVSKAEPQRPQQRTEATAPQPSHARHQQPQQQPQQPQQQQQPKPKPTLQAHPLPPVPVQTQPSSRHTSASSEHPVVRPGVEIVRARPEPAQPAQPLPAPPVVVEKIVTAPSKPEPEMPTTPARAENPRFKQLRFETPPQPQLSHKGSDVSLAGSMIAHFGDSPQSTELQRIQVDSDFSEEESDGSGSGDDDSEITSCEDNSADPYVDTKPPARRNVRFAEPQHSPVRASHVDKTRKAQETQAPAFELPIPSSNRYPVFNSTKTKQPVPPARRQ